jgi:DUF971 family protein
VSITQITVTDIKLRRAENLLDVTFSDQACFSLPAEYLRVESPSAEVQGHSAAEHRLVPGKADIAITNIEPVGNYAIRLIFSDGHDTGIYSWDILHRLGREQPQRWAAYVKRLTAAGLER